MRSGDTLGGIASAIWGDASLWYKIAEANGLNGSSALASGSQLRIPQNVTRSSNNASTFKVYNPAEAIGDTAPTTPEPPKAGGKCGVFGQILLVAIAVAVTVISKGTLTAALGPVLGGAAAGAAGSIVSQSFGVATGIQESFSFKGVALAAIGGGVGGGLGELIPDSSVFGSAFTTDVVRGALTSAVTQGIGVATGLQSKFSFVGVAAAGIGAGIGGEIGRRIGFVPGLEGFDLENAAKGLVSGMAGGIAAAATRSAIEGSSFGDNLLRELPSTLGNTIGQSIAGAVNGGGLNDSAAAGDSNSDDNGAVGDTGGANSQSAVGNGQVGQERDDNVIVVTAPRLGGNYFDPILSSVNSARATTNSEGRNYLSDRPYSVTVPLAPPKPFVPAKVKLGPPDEFVEKFDNGSEIYKRVDGTTYELRPDGTRSDIIIVRARKLDSGTIDGNILAKSLGIGVKSDRVKISKLDPALEQVFYAVAQATKDLGIKNRVITSGNDSRHKRGSLHYKDRALDFRGNDIRDSVGIKLQNHVKNTLGPDFDVFFEIFPKNPANDHLHVEYDPKKGN